MMENIDKILVTEAELRERVRENARIISEDYQDKKLVVIGILKGCFVYLADLVRYITVPLELDFMIVSSYGNSTNSSGDIKIIKDVEIDVKDKDILIVDDILDTGITASCIKQLYISRGARSVKFTAILNKPSRRLAEMDTDYPSIEIPDYFVVGYGLDYANTYRNLPFVGTLKNEVYKQNEECGLTEE